MSPSKKMVELLAKQRGGNVGKEFSKPRNLKVVLKKVSQKKKIVVKKFLAVSPIFMRKYSKVISSASHLINSNYKKLLRGEVVSEKGFVIKKDSTGNSHKGINNRLLLRVSFQEKVFFVKIGADCGERTFLAYQKAKTFFESMNNQFNGYKVGVVPYHFIYQSVKSSDSQLRGFLVSDFFPKNKVSLVLDIERLLGEKAFYETKLGVSFDKLRSKLSKEGFLDCSAHNCFFDEVKNSLYFFDLNIRV